MALTYRSSATGGLVAVRGVLLRAVLLSVLAGVVLMLHCGAGQGAIQHQGAAVAGHPVSRAGNGPGAEVAANACCSSEGYVAIAAEDSTGVLPVPTMGVSTAPRGPGLSVPPTPPGGARFSGRWRVPDPVSELGVHRV